MNFKQVLNNYRSCELMFVELFGLMINVQSMAITTDFEWKPSSHTYAYFPMVNNTTDQLGHLSFSGGTQKTIGGHTGFEWSINTNIAYSGYNSRMQFIVVRIYQYGGSTSSNFRQLLCLWNSMLYNELWREGEYGNTVQIQTQNSSSGKWSGGYKEKTGMVGGQWYLLAYGYDGSKGYLSVNGENYREIGGPSSSAGYSGYGYFMYGSDPRSTGAKMVLGATIYEDQMWSIADLKKYWNKYKSQYGY